MFLYFLPEAKFWTTVKSLYSNSMGQPSRQKNYSFLKTRVGIFAASATINWTDFHFSVGFYSRNNLNKHSHEGTVYMLWGFLLTFEKNE